MQVILLPLYRVVSIAIELYIWALIVSAIMSWLAAFNIINTYNRFVYQVMAVLNRITEPALQPLRRFLPNLGGVDLSPIVLILILYFLQSVLYQLVIRLAF